MKQLKKVAIFILLLLGTLMLFIGIMNKMVPPALTGIGFGVIALVFLGDTK